MFPSGPTAWAPSCPEAPAAVRSPSPKAAPAPLMLCRTISSLSILGTCSSRPFPAGFDDATVLPPPTGPAAHALAPEDHPHPHASGAIVGQVTYHGDPQAGVVLRLVRLASSTFVAERRAVTDDQGRYRFLGVPSAAIGSMPIPATITTASIARPRRWKCATPSSAPRPSPSVASSLPSRLPPRPASTRRHPSSWLGVNAPAPESTRSRSWTPSPAFRPSTPASPRPKSPSPRRPSRRSYL